jgi:tetratricopeptide (TPR) repeat protein
MKNNLFLRLIFFASLGLLSLKATPQNKQLTDSLVNLIKSGNDDTLKAKHLNDLVWYTKFSNPDTSLILLDQSEALSKKLDFADGLGNSFNNRAIIFTVKGNYNDALKYYQLAVYQFERNNDAEGIGFCYGNMAICFEYQSLFDSALVYNQKALVVREKHGLQKGIAQSNINIGVLYFNKGFYRIAQQHYMKALDFYENKPEKTAIDKSYLGSIQNNLGNIYVEFKNPEKARKYLLDALQTYTGVADSRELAYLTNDLGQVEISVGNFKQANEFLHQALFHANQADDKLIKVNTLQSLAVVNLNTNKPDSALYYARQGIALSSEVNDKKYAVGLYHSIGKIYQQQRQFEKAIQNYRQSITIADEAGIIKEKDKALSDLAECYAQLGNHQKANETLKLYIAAADSVMNSEIHRQVAEMEALYENEKKTRQLEATEAENRLLQEEAELQRIRISGKNKLIFSITIGILLLSMALVALVLEYRRKNAAYNALYRKSIVEMKAIEQRKNMIGLKNGDLFELIEQKMQEDYLYRIKDLSQDMMADLLKTNRTYISQSIIDHSGQTFRDYLKSYRIKEAMEFLADKKRAKMFSIEGIAKEVGFNTIGPFNAAFKEITGLTPSQFRHQAGNN